MMNKILLLSLMCVMAFSQALLAQTNDTITGFWKSFDEDTGKAQSLVAVYEYGGKYYGRIIATYDDKTGEIDDSIEHPIEHAPGIIGNPFYSGLDLIWGLQQDGSKYVNGKIVDPEHGKVYDAEAWREGPNLIIRGKLFFFGRNQTWSPATEKDFPKGFQKPNLEQLTPIIPQTKG